MARDRADKSTNCDQLHSRLCRPGRQHGYLLSVSNFMMDRSPTDDATEKLNTDKQYARWRRGSVVRTSVFGWRTFPDLRLIYG